MALITANAEQIAIRYGNGRQLKLKTGSWLTCCPAHNDEHPSLTVTDGRKHILFTCHAGCETKDIMDIVRADMSDPNQEKRTNVKKEPPKKKAVETLEWCDEGLDTIPEIPPMILNKMGAKVSEKWPWHNKKGEIIRWMFRLELDDGKKTFLAMSVWYSKKKNIKFWRLADTEKRYPYKIHLDDGKKTIIHVEGEKCVKRAEELFGTEKFHITTIGGSNAKCDLSTFEGRNVICICDMDSSGYNVGSRLSKVKDINLWVVTPTTSMLPTESGYDICNMTENESDEFVYEFLRKSKDLFHKVS